MTAPVGARPVTTTPVDQVRDTLSRTAGLRFDDSRRDGLQRTVTERARVRGVDPASYPALLETDPDELVELLAEVTVPETHFFRNPPQIRALRSHVLPELAARALREDRPLRIWSAGCATGEEPYTMAMLVSEVAASLPGGHALTTDIVGTDISGRVLAQAAAATYRRRSVATADESDQRRWFVQEGDRYRPVPEVLSMVRLARHNLAADPPPFPAGAQVDLVLCRNVTIYLDRAVTRDLMARLHELLFDGGYLFLGHSETLWQVNDHFRLVTLGDAFVYRRDDSQVQQRLVSDRRSTGRTVPVERRSGPRRLAERLLRRDPETGALLSGDPGADQLLPGPAADGPTASPDAKARRWPLLPSPSPPVDPSGGPGGGGTAVTGAAVGGAAVEGAAAGGDLERAWAAWAGGDLGAALALATTVSTGLPMTAAGHHVRGLALSGLERWPEALVALRAAAYADPDDGLVHEALAAVQAQLGQGPAARVSWRNAGERLLSRPPGDHPALGGRAVEQVVRDCRRLASGGVR